MLHVHKYNFVYPSIYFLKWTNLRALFTRLFGWNNVTTRKAVNSILKTNWFDFRAFLFPSYTNRNIVSRKKRNCGCTTSRRYFNTSAPHRRWKERCKNWRTSNLVKFQRFIHMQIRRPSSKVRSTHTKVTQWIGRTWAKPFSGGCYPSREI